MKNRLRTATVLAAIALATTVPRQSHAETMKLFYTPAERAAIRQMPITERPYRVGHIYGNTVRLLDRLGLWYGPR